MNIIKTFIFSFIVMCWPTANAANMDEKAIDQVMEKLKSSFIKGDYLYGVEVMYTPILVASGGKEANIKIARTLPEKMKAQNLEIIRWEVKKPYQFIQTVSRQFAVIPYEMVIAVNGRKWIQSSYQLGIKESGATWQFLNGDNLNPQIFKNFFPDFPKKFTLPELKRTPEQSGQ